MKKTSLVDELNLGHISSIEIDADEEGTYVLAAISMPVPGFDSQATMTETLYLHKHPRLQKVVNSLYQEMLATLKNGDNVSNNPCATCDSNCCSKWGESIWVSNEDVNRICEGQDESYRDEHFEKAEKKHSNFFLYGKAKDKQVGEYWYCIFFDEKAKNCGIHKKKPQVCREYSPHNCVEYQVDKEKLRKHSKKR